MHCDYALASRTRSLLSAASFLAILLSFTQLVPGQILPPGGGGATNTTPVPLPQSPPPGGTLVDLQIQYVGTLRL